MLVRFGTDRIGARPHHRCTNPAAGPTDCGVAENPHPASGRSPFRASAARQKLRWHIPSGDDAMKTILLATDGSPSAAHALQFACELCHDSGAKLEVLTVRTLAPHGDPDAPGGDHMDVEPVVRSIAEDAASTAQQMGVEARAHTAYGKPAAMIAELARSLGADLVVVGSHGRDRAQSVVLGSVSRALLSEQRMPPVTIVRGVGITAASDRGAMIHAS
jgi:nucleotide-binding universal stress UspA family protein